MNVFLVDSRTTGALALLFLSASQAPTIPSRSLVIYREFDLLQATSHPLRNDPANCNGYVAKKKPTALKLYKKFRSTTPVTASMATMMGWWIR